MRVRVVCASASLFLVVVLSICADASARIASTPPLAASSQALAKFQNNVTLRWMGESSWELYVENTNRTKFINTFEWDPPAGLTIRSITNSQGGRCKVSNGNIRCSGNIAPIPCDTCEGGAMTIDFVGSGFDSKWVPTEYGGFWIAYGWQPGSLSVTAVSSFGDLPLCAKGQVSTTSKPCAKA